MKYVKITNDDSFTMLGTEGTGSYERVLKNSLVQVGSRDLGGGKFRLRVEPASAISAQCLTSYLRREDGWKQPGDQGQVRFSIVSEDHGDYSNLIRDVIGANNRLMVAEVRRRKLAGCNSASRWNSPTLQRKLWESEEV